MLIAALTHTMRGNYANCWGKVRPQSACVHHYLESVGCLFFYPFRNRRSTRHGSFLKSNKPQQKKKNNTTPTFLTLTTRQNEILASSLTAHQHAVVVVSSRACLWQLAPHNLSGSLVLVSSEYLWMLLSGHIPLSGRLPGMGLPILSPCSRLCLGALHFIQLQCVFRRAWLPPALPVLWRKMRSKKQHGRKRVVSSEVKKIYTGERWVAFSRLQSLN